MMHASYQPCPTTGCLHCTKCGLGPQIRLRGNNAQPGEFYCDDCWAKRAPKAEE